MNISEPDANHRILIIAEIGQNHNGEMEIARKLISAAKEEGADIAKFQLYDVDAIFPPDFEWYKEAREAQLNKKQVAELADYCGKAGIEFMASAFDAERVGWGEEISMKRYKIASRSIYDKQLIDAVAKTGKDLIVSLGMYQESDFPSIDTGARVDFLYCVAKYPALPEDLNFLDVDFNRYAGFSDHTIGIDAALVAMARGARIIEKHFTLDKGMHGPDHAGSMEPQELRQIVESARKFEAILYH
ncbi:N-acetylneuraminate synthase family protein [Chloroflexota bacterium]